MIEIMWSDELKKNLQDTNQIEIIESMRPDEVKKNLQDIKKIIFEI